MKRILFFLFVFAFSSELFSQETIQLKDAVYHRNSLTYIFENYYGSYSTLVTGAMPKVSIPNKLDDNRISNPVITRLSVAEGNYSQNIINDLQKEKIPNVIIANWFNRKSDGSFDMNLVLQRGQYDANDAAILTALSMHRGLSAIDKTAMELVGNSFILVMNIVEVHSIDDEYNKVDKIRRAYAKGSKIPYKAVERLFNGFKAQVQYRLFQINFNDSIASLFYNNLWVDPDDPPAIKSQKKRAFDNFEFPLIFQFQTTRNSSGIQINQGLPLAPLQQATDEELMIKMFQNGVNGFLGEVEKLLPRFRVRANLINSHPIEAKIGSKEGLKTDQRFFVYEDKMNKAGVVKTVRKGVVRVKRVENNQTNSQGDSKGSVFYQVAGLSLKTGMIMEQHKGANMAFSAGYNFIGDVNGVELRLDYNLSSLFASFSSDGNAVPGFKIYFEIGIDNQTYRNTLFKFYDIENIFESTTDRKDDEVYKANFSFFRLGLGLSKNFQLSSNVSIVPELAWNYEMAIATKLKDEADQSVSLKNVVDKNTLSKPSDVDVSQNLQYNVHYIIVGAEIVITIAYPFQLYGKLDYFMPFIGALDRDNHLYTNSWRDFFENRAGMTIGAGIRIEF